MAGESIRFNASLNTAGFDSGAARLQQIAAQTSSKVSASFASMGARIASVIAPFVGLYAAISSVKSALDFGGRMNDLSKTTGETAGNLAILERAFQNAGVGGEKMGMAIASMSNFITDFQNGSKTASATMDRLGISMADLAGKTPIEKMRVFMSAIVGIQDPTLRTALAMDVFKKAGKEIVPLASEFSGELANASQELGSLPRILNENAASLDQLGDRLTNAVGNKLTELAVGLAAGATGADNFVAALAKIDAAGLGERIGNALRAAFAAPLEVLQGVGDFLISGILKAGNALVAAFKYALDVFYNLFTDSGYWSGIGDRITGGLAKIGEGFALLVVNGLQQALSALKDVPFLGDFAAQAEQALEGVKNTIIEAGKNASMAIDEGGQKIAEAWDNATRSSKYIYDDILGAEKYSQSATDHWEKAKNASETIRNNSAQTADNFGKGSAAITNALNEIRGFSLDGGKPVKKPDWFKSLEPVDTSAPASGGAGSGGRSGSGLSRESNMTRNERIGDMRGSFNSRAADERARQYEAAGMFNSSVRAQDKAQRIRDRAMETARDRDRAAEFNFDGRKAGNMGEAMKSISDKIGRMDALDRMRNAPGYDPKKGETENMKNAIRQGAYDDIKNNMDKMAKEQSKSPKDRAIKDEESKKGGTAGGKSKDGSDLWPRMVEYLKSIDKKLPQHALV